ncbi:hypothetical protein ACJMK2_017495 [Sinanodonta woodiana]|uniref:G-protein coupled receptors family 1 profile domain-containing protein n=1 Tax=Sinanodonta woodiana TaxID=1069815 RepID=A0ABD3UAW2_SINWO
MASTDDVNVSLHDLNDSNFQNGTAPSQEMLIFIYRAQHIMYRYILPIIVFTGIFGNILSICVYSSKVLRPISSSVYLLAVLLADTGMLICLAFVWLEVLGYPFNHYNGLCQSIVYLTYACGFLSVWYVVCITIENYITICHPTRIKTLCTLTRARIITSLLAALAAASYAIALVINSVQEDPRHTHPICQQIEKYQDIGFYLSYIDSVTTILLPIVVIIILLAFITTAVISSIQRKKSRSSKISGSVLGSNSSSSMPQVRVAKMLFILSVTFVVLSVPSHVIRIRLQFFRVTMVSHMEAFIQLVFLFVSYTNFSTKFFIFIALSNNFRKALLNLFCISESKYVSLIQRNMSKV